MSVVVEPNDKPDSINPDNVRKELVRYLTTSINYVKRQGLTDDEIRAVVIAALLPAPKPFVPELLDKGVNDMRDRMAN